MTEPSRRFPAPWRPDRIPGGYVVRDASGLIVAWVYDARARRPALNGLRDQAQRLPVHLLACRGPCALQKRPLIVSPDRREQATLARRQLDPCGAERRSPLALASVRPVLGTQRRSTSRTLRRCQARSLAPRRGVRLCKTGHLRTPPSDARGWWSLGRQRCGRNC
jgi:hypothetical protein